LVAAVGIPIGSQALSDGEGRRPPDVFIVVVDALRGDRLGRGLTPFLDEVATGGLRFANAYATSAWTRPSVASLFTGQLPSRHGIASFTAVIPESQTTWAELLAAAGYRTAGFSANPLVDSRNGSAQGFTHFESVGDGDPDPDAKVHAPRVFARALAWLDAILAADPSQQRPLSITDLVGGPALGGGLAALPLAPGPGFTVAAAERLHALGYVVP